VTLNAAHLPFPEQPRAERLVEAPRPLVPVEDRPLEAMAAALDGHARDGTHQGQPDTLSPHLGIDEEVLEPEARRRGKRRVGLEEERVSADVGGERGDQYLEAGPRTERILDQAARRVVVRRRELLEVGEPAHQANERRPVDWPGRADLEPWHGTPTVC